MSLVIEQVLFVFVEILEAMQDQQWHVLVVDFVVSYAE